MSSCQHKRQRLQRKDCKGGSICGRPRAGRGTTTNKEAHVSGDGGWQRQWRLAADHGGRGSCSEQGVTRLWRAIRAPAWLLLTSSPPPQARRPWLRAGRQVVRSDRPGLARFAGAGALDTRPAGLNADAHPGDGDQTSTGNPADPLALPMRSAPPPPGGLRRPKKASSARQRQMLMPLAACMQPCWKQRGPPLVLFGVFRCRSATRSEGAE